MSNKRVSVVIPCFNAARWIAETIDSALSQDIRDLEVVDRCIPPALRHARIYRRQATFLTGADVDRFTEQASPAMDS
jgi:GT2 family glycosyltransferase